MSTLHPRFRRLAAFSLALLLAACGGGGGGSTGPLPSFDTSAVAAADAGGMPNADWRAGPFAEIFVRGYQDSDGDGIGDLKGLTSRLDYLKDLGVTGIWLMPITRSQDHDHGYAVSDYRNVEPAYGSLDDLNALVAQAHARGIGVVLDYVMNHSAAQHPAFVNANSGSGNAYRNWYIFNSPCPGGWSIYGNNPWRSGTDGCYFAPFWDQMPDFNLKNTTVVTWHQDNLRFWLNRGVDGFRFDAVGNLVENGPSAWENQPENFALMGNIRDMVGGSYANRFLVCEGPSAPLAFATACGSAFAFGHQSDLINAAKGDTTAIANLANYFRTAPAAMSTMLSNHDSFAGQRAMDQFNGDEAQYKLAAATYLLQPGTPFIYYGEEIGMRGASANIGDDPKLRTPMSWTSSNTGSGGFTTGTPFRALSSNVATNNVQVQQANNTSLFNWYKAVIAARQANPALRSGTHVSATATGTTLSFQRATSSQRAVVMINYGSGPALVSASGLPANGLLTSVFPPGGVNADIDAGGTASATIPAQSLRVFVIAP
ncbi:MAG: alpha-amylase [Piscinibacter sp.]|uniref:alpha-amylase family glycosyl hydrolase n=1 Tax=Piscinibacter sp. TaxID=1903157 RepID=UPI001B4737C5|nr:alpha-amylase family glycosyl hydrolase [Piscinibacter sp.]MBP5989836.1 alpha-amylase [Piscinibacter sp.]MBP6027009.1 alpha-amylase [Piscinibacter sp.]